jgi:hypothetical protein
MERGDDLAIFLDVDAMFLAKSIIALSAMASHFWKWTYRGCTEHR